ncbi:Cysteine-rich receptor-like protein kinase 25 [Abeliophyllum distichum]|uniref:Cysteine-rich receptor-like protein kinase 25 n=1 Tax=Abeliophyllum distichum TaxID=126358 RepID=A0ABD1PXF3_9LAMI
MISWKWLAFIFLNLTNLFASVKSQNYNCIDNGNYTSNSTYRANLNTFLSSVSSNIDSNGFYNTSTGDNPNRVYSVALCRGDVQLDTCRSCINNAARTILQLCPHQKKAILWDQSDKCMIRYSNEYIFGTLETFPRFYGWNLKNVTSKEEFNKDLKTLLDSLRDQAAHGGSLKKFAAAIGTGPDILTIYGLVQCTPDLTSEDCRDCLIQVANVIQGCCSGKEGFGILTPSCILRYEIYPFYTYTPQPAPPTTTPVLVPVPVPTPPISTPPGNEDYTTQTITIIIVPIVVGLILALSIGLFLRMRKKHKPKEKLENDNEISFVESLHYDFGTIRAATDNFSDANKLGQGGFGIVYKGKLPSGQEIAVKRLSMNSGQGDLEFKNEVVLVARLQHRNLVRLLGFSLQGSERLLIYEFVNNGSLDHFLFDPIKRPSLDWYRRYKIIEGVARGILYLHEDSRLTIIHRDLKAGNVLLDEEMNAKISDFGMAKLFVQDQTQGNTSRVVGTYGYMAPEYALHGKFSSKSDVFSFGVLVLEIISGQKINSFRNGENVENLLSCAWENWHGGTAAIVIDPALRTCSGSFCDIMRCIHIGLLCVQEDEADRPKMASIVLMLTSFSITLPMPSQPAFFVSRSFDPKISPLLGHKSRPSKTTGSSNNRSGNFDHPLSTNDPSMSELYPRNGEKANGSSVRKTPGNRGNKGEGGDLKEVKIEEVKKG